jgi:hypothetical protein
MGESRELTDRRGRTWTLERVRLEDAEEADFRFWYERLTPEERVAQVGVALANCSKAKGQDEVPRLRRVHRRIRRRIRAVPECGGEQERG